MKTVTLNLDAISVVVEGATKEQLLENAKQAVIQQLMQKFPHFSYSVNDVGALTFDTVQVGMIVESNDGHFGIITGVNQKTINVCLTGNRIIQGSPTLFKKSDVSFEQARSKRPDWAIESKYFAEGTAGYLQVKENQLVPVVIGKSRGAKIKFFTINSEKGTHYTITEEQAKKFFKDEK